MNNFGYYCPICATELCKSKPSTIQLSKSSYRTSSNDDNLQPYRCLVCGELVKATRTKYELTHYIDIANERYGNDNRYIDVILEEIKQNPLFSEKKYRAAKQKIKEENDAQWRERIIKNTEQKSTEAQYVPKCPTCGSANIEKISTTSKVVGATMFGLLSKTARSQFKCKNCGYKW